MIFVYLLNLETPKHASSNIGSGPVGTEEEVGVQGGGGCTLYVMSVDFSKIFGWALYKREHWNRWVPSSLFA